MLISFLVIVNVSVRFVLVFSVPSFFQHDSFFGVFCFFSFSFSFFQHLCLSFVDFANKEMSS